MNVRICTRYHVCQKLQKLFLLFFAWDHTQSHFRSTSQSSRCIAPPSCSRNLTGKADAWGWFLARSFCEFHQHSFPGGEHRYLLSLLSFCKDEPALPSAEDVSTTDLVIGVITHRSRHFQIFSACIMVWQGLLQQRYLWVKAIVLQFNAIGKPESLVLSKTRTPLCFWTPKIGNGWQLNYTEFKGTHELDWFLAFKVLEGWWVPVSLCIWRSASCLNNGFVAGDAWGSFYCKVFVSNCRRECLRWAPGASQDWAHGGTGLLAWPIGQWVDLPDSLRRLSVFSLALSILSILSNIWIKRLFPVVVVSVYAIREAWSFWDADHSGFLEFHP